MFELLGRPEGRPWSAASARALPAARSTLEALGATRGEPVILHMRENRSHLPEAGRQTLAVMVFTLMVLTILPALHGHWLVPLYSLAMLAALTFALERHGKTPLRCEVLEFLPGRVRHRGADGQTTELPSLFLRLSAEERRPFDCRLFLRTRDRSLEIGLCLAVEERRAMAPLIAAALDQTRGR